MSSVHFVAVGHICRDVAPDGYRIGGAASYSTLTARRLGFAAGAVTAFDPSFDLYKPVLTGVDVRPRLTDATTTFHNVYDEKGHRRQTLLDIAGKLTRADVPFEWRSAPIIYLCPIADEVEPDVCDAFEDGVVGATPQGWLRQWDASGHVTAKPWTNAEAFLPRLDALILSVEDIAPFPDELDRYRALTRRVVLTQGSAGATLYEGKKAKTFPAYPAREVEPTGAGDVFAAAFLLRLAETGDSEEAVDYANCVASFAVEAVGTEGIPSAEQVAERRSR
jgi:sugar/nucleoside kinase (ribokinase family)